MIKNLFFQLAIHIIQIFSEIHFSRIANPSGKINNINGKRWLNLNGGRFLIIATE
jgi:hypothetical protein